MRRSDFLTKTSLGALSLLGADKWMGRENRSKNLIKPKRLQPGDTVAFSAPAGILYERSDFDKMERVMDGFGFKVRFGEYVRERYGYFSGTDLQRAMDLNRFFVDASVDAIIAVRGGWGASRILPYLNFSSIQSHPKILCGFSDITTLHLAILKECGLVTFHGPNGASEWSELTKDSFKRVLIDGEKAEYISKGRVRTLSPGMAEGPLIGGNLTILTTSLGTPYQPDCSGAILFMEDIGEPVYKIDRMLTHLKGAGLMDGIHGFVFGDCTDCPRPRADHFTLLQILRQHIEPLEIPAVMGVNISHGDDNFTIPMGINAKLDADSGVIALLESSVI